MKHRIVFCVLMILLCLASCSRRETMDEAGEIADFYAELTQANMQVTLSADFGDRVSVFVLKYTFFEDAASTVEILEPEEVRGVKAVIEAGQSKLEYDGLILETGPLPGTGLTPMDALPVMLNTWRSGYVFSVGSEKLDGEACLHVVYKATVSGVEIQQDAWFDASTYKPIKAETAADGVRVIDCVFDTVKFE